MFNRIVLNLTDEELESLSVAVYNERTKRDEKKYDNDEFPEL